MTPYANLYHNTEQLHALQDEPDSSDDEADLPLFIDNPEVPDAAPDMHVFDNQEIHAPSTPVIVDHSQIIYDVSSSPFADDPNLSVLAHSPQPQNVILHFCIPPFHFFVLLFMMTVPYILICFFKGFGNRA